MTTQTPITIRWRGRSYTVACAPTRGQETVTVTPEQPELQNIILQELKANPEQALALYQAFAGLCLASDIKRGEA